jgi:hypothetical protein
VRLKKEEELFKKGMPIPQPTKEQLDKEKNETGPYFVFTIKDQKGTVVRKLYKSAQKGIHRATWDLRYMNPSPVRLRKGKFNPLNNGSDGMLALPGKYTVSLTLFHNGEEKTLAGPITFTAKVLNNTTLPAKDRGELNAFFDQISDVWRVAIGAEKYLNSLESKTAYIQQALQVSNGASLTMKNEAEAVKEELEKIDFIFNGTPAKASFEEVPPAPMALLKRLNEAVYASWQSTSSPTSTQKMNIKIVKDELPGVLERIQKVDQRLKALEKQLDAIKAPYTPGRLPKL